MQNAGDGQRRRYGAAAGLATAQIKGTPRRYALVSRPRQQQPHAPQGCPHSTHLRICHSDTPAPMRPTPRTTEGLTSTLTMARVLPAAARRRSLLPACDARPRRRGAACREPNWVGSAPAAAPARPAAAAGAWWPASRHRGRAAQAPGRAEQLLRGAKATPGLGAASSPLAAACIVTRPACEPLQSLLTC